MSYQERRGLILDFQMRDILAGMDEENLAADGISYRKQQNTYRG